MPKYLYIMEDGAYFTIDGEPTESDIQNSNNGDITIIRLSDMKEQSDGDWSDISKGEFKKDPDGDYWYF